MLFNLSLELLPFLRNLAFYNNDTISQLPSPLINKAFKAVINISTPISVEQSDFLNRSPNLPISSDSYIPPDYHKLDMWELASMVKETPLFSLKLIEKFLHDFEFEVSDEIEFYKELNARLGGDTTKSYSETKSMVVIKYEHLFRKNFEKQNFDSRC